MSELRAALEAVRERTAGRRATHVARREITAGGCCEITAGGCIFLKFLESSAGPPPPA